MIPGLFLNLYTLPNATEGIDEIAIQTIIAVPSLSPLILFFVYFVIFLGGIARQLFKSGTADYASWSVVATLSTFMVALVMSIKVGFIRLDWLGIVIGLTILSGVWLFLDRKQSEV